MKLLFAIKTLNKTHGGAERVLCQVSSGLSAKNHDVSVLTFDQAEGSSFYPLNENIERLYISVGDVTQRSGFISTLKRMLAARRAVIKAKPEAVIAFMHSMFIPLSFALIGTGIPVIASEHIVPDYYRKRRAEFVLLILSSFFTKRITVLSEKVKALYPRLVQKRMAVMPNPVIQTDENADVMAKNLKTKTILNVGRLDPQKDQETLINAFAQLAESHPDWNLKIIGDGALKPDLERLIKKHKLEDRIHLAGTTADIGAAYKHAQIFAMSSRFEAFGLVSVEAMSYGVPPIGFADCAGTNEVITHNQNGLLVSGDNRVQNFAQGLETLIKTPELRQKLGRQAKESAKAYKPEIIVDQWQDFIKDTLKS